MLGFNLNHFFPFHFLGCDFQVNQPLDFGGVWKQKHVSAQQKESIVGFGRGQAAEDIFLFFGDTKDSGQDFYLSEGLDYLPNARGSGT